MKILITGVSGYLGSQLANALMLEHEVVGTVRAGSVCNRITDIGNVNLINVTDSGWIDKVCHFLLMWLLILQHYMEGKESYFQSWLMPIFNFHYVY